MSIDELKEKWKSWVGKMNAAGVPLPTIRDPKTGKGSVSLTLTFISFNMVLLGLIGKASGFLGGVDISQALNLFYACAALYWGRKISKDGSKAVLDSEAPKSDQPDNGTKAP